MFYYFILFIFIYNLTCKKDRNNNIGDQYIEVKIEIPKRLSRQESDLYQQLQDQSKSNKSVFERFKDSFRWE